MRDGQAIQRVCLWLIAMNANRLSAFLSRLGAVPPRRLHLLRGAEHAPRRRVDSDRGTRVAADFRVDLSLQNKSLDNVCDLQPATREARS